MEDKDLMTPEEVTKKLLLTVADQIAKTTPEEDETEEEPDSLKQAAQGLWNAYQALRGVGFTDAQAFTLLQSFFGFVEP